MNQISQAQYEREVLQSSIPVLVKVSTQWCPPCRAMKPIVEELSATMSGQIKFVELDGDEATEIVEGLRVRGFPTMIVFSNGAEVGRLLGAVPKTKLARFLRELL
jgi:thioredoxin 1